MKIIFVRHGQTFANEKKLYQGFGDSKLNNIGITQAENVAEMLKIYNINNTYCSVMTRCIQTLDYIKNKNKTINKIEYLESLKEINFGLWEDKKFEEIEKEFKNEYNEFLNDGLKFTFPEGENHKDFYRRSIDTYNYILEKSHYNDTILIVSHSGIIRCIVSYLLDLEQKGFYIFNPRQGAYSLIQIIDNHIEIEYINKDR